MVRITRPTGPNVMELDRQRDSVNRSGFDLAAAARNPPSTMRVGAPNGWSALPAGAAGIGRRQSPHQAAPGSTSAAHPPHRRVEVSEAMLIVIDKHRPRVDPRSRVSRAPACPEMITVP